MEPETKRIKIEEQSPPAREMQIMDLIEDCIFEILGRLAPDDLCSMSFTCKYLQTLAFDQFQRQYPEQFITIETKENDGKISVDSNYNGKHLKYFSKFIQNVRVYGSQSMDTRILFDFVKTECAPKLNILDIITSGIILPSDGEIIKDQLEKLEILTPIISNAESSSYDALMKHCKNLKHLKVFTNSFESNVDWLLQHYPTLESLGIKFYYIPNNFEEFIMRAGRLIRNNPQIKDFSCYGSDLTKAILQNAVDIKRLEIECFDSDELSSILDDLKLYCKNSPIECLEFELRPLDISCLKMLRDFNQINPIHGLNIDKSFGKLSRPIPVIMDFKNLKKLELYIWFGGQVRSIEFDYIEKLSMGMLLLEEIKLRIWADDDDFVKKCLMSFVRNSVSMKRLKFDLKSIGKYIEFNRNDFLIMNATRLRHPGSCSMEIHFVHTNNEGNHMEQVFNIPSDVNATKCMILNQIEIW